MNNPAMERGIIMDRLQVLRSGFALGTTFALLYVGCMFVMWTVPQATVILFFNSLMHGLDVEPIIRWDIRWWESLLGLIQIFILGWLIGASFAVLYNLPGLRPHRKASRKRD